jgi:hypothetical protein
MITILKAKYDDYRGRWISNEKKLREILQYTDSIEMFIIYMNEKKEEKFCLLTDISGNDVIVGNRVIKISDLEAC